MLDRLGLKDLNARSVIISTLLGSSSEEVPASTIVRTAELFGIATGTTRVALTRLAAAGDVTADAGVYKLAQHHLARRQRQLRSLRPSRHEWCGVWLSAVLMGEAREAQLRQKLRDAFRRERFVELREGLWMRPDNIEAENLTPAMSMIEQQCQWLFAEVGPELETSLVELFKLSSWSEYARLLIKEMEQLLPSFLEHDANEFRRGFLLEGAVIRHLNADPLLPQSLLSDDWPGELLRDTYVNYDEHFRKTLEHWNSAG